MKYHASSDGSGIAVCAVNIRALRAASTQSAANKDRGNPVGEGIPVDRVCLEGGSSRPVALAAGSRPDMSEGTGEGVRWNTHWTGNRRVPGRPPANYASIRALPT
ncbi:hypothetical protein GCM10027432_04200 [Lysobacter fragariae]